MSKAVCHPLYIPVSNNLYAVPEFVIGVTSTSLK